MTTVATSTTDLQLRDEAFAIDDAQLAAVAFLARYHGRTLCRGRRSGSTTIAPSCRAADAVDPRG
jgi:hypothetical protein